MPQHPTDLTVHDEFWRPTVVYGMASACLLLGLAIGYLLRGSESHSAIASSPSHAAAYFDRALKVDAKNVSVRTEMASCLYYDGNVDGALEILQESLMQNPADANSLFNLGVIRWKGKKDASGAIAAWKQ